MDFKLIWSDEAITDLRGICSYIARDNPEAALRMGNGILDHALRATGLKSSAEPFALHWTPRSRGVYMFDLIGAEPVRPNVKLARFA